MPLVVLLDRPIVSNRASVLTCSQVLHDHQRFASVQKGTPGLGLTGQKGLVTKRTIRYS
jgi:hypothetical protein